jgi:hypothetical protein
MDANVVSTIRAGSSLLRINIGARALVLESKRHKFRY